MDFVSAVKSCFAQYAGFSGRAPRSEFWWFALFQLGVLVIATLISEVLYGIAALALLLPALAVGAVASRFVHTRINAKVMRYFVQAFAIVSGLVLLIKAF